MTAPLWRYVEYRCGSCKEWCLVDHADRAAKFRECRACNRVPELDQERVDHRITSLLWAHLLAATSTTTGRAGTAERRALPSGAAGSGPLRVDPEAGPQADPEGRPTSGGAEQRQLNDFVVTDGGRNE